MPGPEDFREPFTEHPDDERGTHRTHCCKRHGCKYGQWETCPVANNKVVQAYLCEDCGDHGWNRTSTRVYIVIEKIPENEVEGLAWLPTDQQVRDEINEVLKGREGSGWRIVHVN